MSEEEVVGLIGPPIAKEPPQAEQAESRDVTVIRLYRWEYGRLPIESPMVPAYFCFDLYFFQGRIRFIEQPFETCDVNAVDLRIPSRPRVIYPQKKEVFRHYPRIVDFRWQPSVGEYPMRYVVEIESGLPACCANEDGGRQAIEYRLLAEQQVAEPYYCLELPGKQNYQWRVKAVNLYGESNWSEAREFRFDV